MRDDKPSRVTSRSEKVGKKRKANTVYNILLAVVIVLIIIVGASIFLNSNDDEKAAPAPEEKTENHESKADKEKDKAKDDSKEDNKKEDSSKDEEPVDEDEDKTQDSDELKKPSEEDEIVENGDPSVAETRVNSSWEPVGTEQTGTHVTTFDDTSADWKEMEKALAYGSGLEQGNMTVHWLGNGGAPNKAVGTVAAKGDSTKYKVYIEWVDGQGWKPTKVEKLK